MNDAAIDAPPRPRWYLPVVVTLLVMFAGQAVLSMRHKTVTVDEISYLAAGYYHLKTGKFDLNKTNPPLLKVLPALPLLLVGPDLPEMEGDIGSWEEIDNWRFARKFLYENSVSAETILFWARIPVVLLGLLLGLLTFRWTRQIYGDRAALLALFLFSFSPNLIAHSRFATQDLGLALFFTATLYSFSRYLNEPSWRRLLLCGCAFGCAVLTKTTSIFLTPIACAYALGHVVLGTGVGIWEKLPLISRVSAQRVRLRQFLGFTQAFFIIGVVLLVCVNAGYFFERPFEALSSDNDHPTLYQKLPIDNGLTRAVVDLVVETPLPVPGAFLDMVRFQGARVGSGNPVYFHGSVSRSGWWYLMFVAILFKSPIPLLILVGAALALMARRRPSSVEWLLLLGAGTLLVLFAKLKSVNVGLRYVLPIYPIAHIVAAGVLSDAAGLWQKRWAKIAIGVLCVWTLVGAIRTYPHYLTHFNELVGGPTGGRNWLADSNLDWGQDLRALKRYMDENGIERVRLAYFGSADAAYHGIAYDYLPSVGLAPSAPDGRWWFEEGGRPAEGETIELKGTIAISATQWAGVFYQEYYAPLRDRTPDAHVGHSILIYHFE